MPLNFKAVLKDKSIPNNKFYGMCIEFGKEASGDHCTLISATPDGNPVKTVLSPRDFQFLAESIVNYLENEKSLREKLLSLPQN